jgi:hypothetical protein
MGRNFRSGLGMRKLFGLVCIAFIFIWVPGTATRRCYILPVIF